VTPGHRVESFGSNRTTCVTAKYLFPTLSHKLSSLCETSSNEAMLPQKHGEPVDEA
jgi:hypothetical protein